MNTKQVIALMMVGITFTACSGGPGSIQVTGIKNKTLPETMIEFDKVETKSIMVSNGDEGKEIIATTEPNQTCTLQYPNETCPSSSELVVDYDVKTKKLVSVRYTLRQGTPANTFDVGAYCPNPYGAIDCTGTTLNISDQSVSFDLVKLSGNESDALSLNLKITGAIDY